MNLKGWIRSVRIFHAISSSFFSILRNSARLSEKPQYITQQLFSRPDDFFVLIQSSDPTASGSLEEEG
jgi:hypothetical protein